MNNLHRRRMQENPYPPLVDYIRYVVMDDEVVTEKILNDTGFVWAYYIKDGKPHYERLTCGSRKNNLNTDRSPLLTIDSNDVIFIGENIAVHGTSNQNKLLVFDASHSKSFKGFGYNVGNIVFGDNVEVIDMTGCGLKNLLLGGYNDIADNWYRTRCKEIRINGCTNAEKLTGIGSYADAKIFGLYDCKKCKNIKLKQINPCTDGGEYISVLDLTNFAQLTTLEIVSCKYITSLNNLPIELTTLNCSSCIGITSLDNLPSNLTTLNCSNCTDITSLDNLPAGLTTLNCGVTGITSLDNLPSGLTSLTCGSLNLSKADFSYTSIETFSAYSLKVQDGIFTPPITLKSFSAGDNKIEQGDFSQCINLETFAAYGQWIVGKLLLPPSIKTLQLGTTWGTWVYPMPDLTDCTNLTSINCQRCTNIPNLDQQAFINSLPTFTDGSTHTINLKNTGVVAETVAAIEAKGWTVQV